MSSRPLWRAVLRLSVKEPLSLFPSPRSWTPMRSLPFFFLKTRRLFFLVCLSVLCFTWPLASKAQNYNADLATIISQQQDQLDKLDYLASWLEYYFTADTLYTYFDESMIDLSSFILTDFWLNRGSPLREIYGSVSNIVSYLTPLELLPAFLSLTNSNSNLSDIREISDGILTHVSSLNMDVPYLLSRFEFDQDDDLFVRDEFLRDHLTFDNALHLYVHDPDVVAALTQTNGNGSGVLGELNTKASSQIYNGEQILDELNSITDVISDLDDAGESSEEVYGNEYSKTRQWQELQESEAEEDYDSIQLPTASIAYEPNFSGMTDEGANYGDLGLNQELPGQHNALIRLVGGSGNRSGPGGNVLPEVEIDLGRDQVLTSRLSSLSEFFGWMYGVFGTMLLSVKGLSMFRKCRLASESSAILGAPDPMTSLAWDPF